MAPISPTPSSPAASRHLPKRPIVTAMNTTPTRNSSIDATIERIMLSRASPRNSYSHSPLQPNQILHQLHPPPSPCSPSSPSPPKHEQFSPLRPSPSNAAAVSTASATGKDSVASSRAELLKSYRKNDVTNALTTHMNIREREKEPKKLSTQHKEAIEKCQTAEAEIKKLRLSLGKQHKELKENKVTIESLQNQVSQHVSSDEETNKLRISLGKQHKEIKEYKSTIDTLTQQTEAQAKKIQDLTHDLESLQEQHNFSQNEHKRQLADQNEEITSLQSQLSTLTTQLQEFKTLSSVQHSQKLQKHISSLNSQLQSSHQTQEHLTSTIEDLQKKLKSKEWMIKSLTDESEDQKSRESHLHSRMKSLQDKLETYETQFQGKDVDVPMVLAKLSDADVRTKELEEQLNSMRKESVNLKLALLAAKRGVMAPPGCDVDPLLMDLLGDLGKEALGRGHGGGSAGSHGQQEGGEPNHQGGQFNGENTSLCENSFEDQEYEDDDDATLNTNASDMVMEEDPFANTTGAGCKSARVGDDYDDGGGGSGGGVFDDLIQDVRVGIKSIQTEGLCVTNYNGGCVAPILPSSGSASSGGRGKSGKEEQ